MEQYKNCVKIIEGKRGIMKVHMCRLIGYCTHENRMARDNKSALAAV